LLQIIDSQLHETLQPTHNALTGEQGEKVQ